MSLQPLSIDLDSRLEGRETWNASSPGNIHPPLLTPSPCRGEVLCHSVPGKTYQYIHCIKSLFLYQASSVGYIYSRLSLKGLSLVVERITFWSRHKMSWQQVPCHTLYHQRVPLSSKDKILFGKKVSLLEGNSCIWVQ